MIFCYVTDRRSLQKAGDPAADTHELLACIEHASSAGADWIQIREKDLNGRELAELTRRAISVVQRRARILVNDRLDVALAADAAGVHLGSMSVPAAEAVRWVRGGNAPADFLVGVSCHSLDEAKEAEKAGANYIFLGPIYETPSKKNFGPPQGLNKLDKACSVVRIPVLAIGGVNEENTRECLRAGAAGVAAIRMFQEETDPTQLAGAISRLRSFKPKTSIKNR